METPRYGFKKKFGVFEFLFPNRVVIARKKLKRCRSDKQEAWFTAINQKDIEKLNVKNLRVFSKHFITGKIFSNILYKIGTYHDIPTIIVGVPSSYMDNDHPDWRPSLHLGYSTMKFSSSPRTKVRKYESLVTRSTVRKELPFQIEELPA